MYMFVYLYADYAQVLAEVLDLPLGLKLHTAVSRLTWTLEAELRSSGRAYMPLTAEPSLWYLYILVFEGKLVRLLCD